MAKQAQIMTKIQTKLADRAVILGSGSLRLTWTMLSAKPNAIATAAPPIVHNHRYVSDMLPPMDVPYGGFTYSLNNTMNIEIDKAELCVFFFSFISSK